MVLRVGLGRAVAAVYEAPQGTVLPHLAVVLLDGHVVTARAMTVHEDAAKYASEALKILRALELSDPELVIEQEL